MNPAVVFVYKKTILNRHQGHLAMSEPPRKSIPSWQRSENSPESSQAIQEEAETPNEAQVSEATTAPEDRSTLLQEARKFLEDEHVRGAAPEHKLAFLKSKGVQSEEIQKLLQAELQEKEQPKV